ncbi:hypothetical protein [Nocardia sp. A7]|uniref:hypothetical protein n=1 Tax=Nocardia sp. A7 TaxID=2789274 RepID=UPI003979CBFC
MSPTPQVPDTPDPDPDPREQDFDDMVDAAFARPGGRGVTKPKLSAEQRAQLGLMVRTQYTFWVVFQSLVAILAIAAVATVVVSLWRLAGGDSTAEQLQEIVVAVAGVVAGGVTGFLQTQVSKTKKDYDVAMGAWRRG